MLEEMDLEELCKNMLCIIDVALYRLKCLIRESYNYGDRKEIEEIVEDIKRERKLYSSYEKNDENSKKAVQELVKIKGNCICCCIQSYKQYIREVCNKLHIHEDNAKINEIAKQHAEDWLALEDITIFGLGIKYLQNRCEESIIDCSVANKDTNKNVDPKYFGLLRSRTLLQSNKWRINMDEFYERKYGQEREKLMPLFQKWAELQFRYEKLTNKKEYEENRDALIQSLIAQEKIDYNKMIAFLSVIAKSRKSSIFMIGANEYVNFDADETDILDGLKSYPDDKSDMIYAMIKKGKYVGRYDDSIITWIESYLNDDVEPFIKEHYKDEKTKLLSTFPTDEQKERYLEMYLLTILSWVILPKITEISVIQQLLNRTRLKKYMDIDDFKLDIEPKKARKILKKINLDAATIKLTEHRKCNEIIGRCEEADLQFLQDIMTEEMASLFSGGNDWIAKRYNSDIIFRPLQRWIEKGEFENIEKYISLTGYNVCSELLAGLDEICLYKDNTKEYKEALEELTEQLARYIKVLGGQTGIVVERLFKAAKEFNAENTLWKVEKRNPLGGNTILRIITRVLSRYDIEEELKELTGYYAENKGFPELEKFYDDSLDIPRLACEERKKLKQRYDELQQKNNLNDLRINTDTYNNYIEPLLCLPLNGKKPSDAKGTWWCILQKLMFNNLNN